jgi:hypothetical protein
MEIRLMGAETSMRMEAAIVEYCRKYDVGTPQHLRYRKDHGVYFELRGMPILPFFVDLADACGIPINNIAVDFSAVDIGGCPTCGPEIEKTVEITVSPV